MSNPSFPDKNVFPFRHFSKKEWTEAAKFELGGADPFEKLKLRKGDVDIFPYYDQNDWSSQDYQLPDSQNEIYGPRSWLNLPPVRVTRTSLANKLALESLNSGADGVLFELIDPSDPEALLEQIELAHCAVAFLPESGHENFLLDLARWTEAKKIDSSSPGGAIFWKVPPPSSGALIEHFSHWTQFHPLGIAAKNISSPTEEIAQLLALASRQVETFAGIEIKNALNAIAFSVFTDNDFFLEIAKLKTLRSLWGYVARAHDPHYDGSIFIHALIRPSDNTHYEPHGNLLHGSTAAMSAILGGCDALTVSPADPDNAMMARVARNVSAVLREESQLGKVSDPVAGSYYLENLCDQLASEVWKKFQRLMAS